MGSIAWILSGIVLRMTSCSGVFHKGWLSSKNTLLTRVLWQCISLHTWKKTVLQLTIIQYMR